MSKWIKAGLIIASIGLLAGGVVFVIGMTILEWDFYRLDTLEYTEHSVSAEELEISGTAEINGFVCNSRDWNIVIRKEAGELFSIKYYTTEQTEEHSVAYDGTTGIITFNYKEKIFSGFTMFGGLMKNKYKVEITIPEDISLTVAGANLNADIADMALKDVSIDSTNADIKLKNVTTYALGFASVNGSLKADNVSVDGDIVFDSTNGSLKMTNTEANALIGTGANCSIKVSGGKFKSAKVDSTNGSVKFESGFVTETLKFTGTNMSVQYNTISKLSDFKLIGVSGTNKSFRLNGDRQKTETVINEEGSIEFTAAGANISVKVNTAE